MGRGLLGSLPPVFSVLSCECCDHCAVAKHSGQPEYFDAPGTAEVVVDESGVVHCSVVR